MEGEVSNHDCADGAPSVKNNGCTRGKCWGGGGDAEGFTERGRAGFDERFGSAGDTALRDAVVSATRLDLPFIRG